jgi:hypothetical protein
VLIILREKYTGADYSERKVLLAGCWWLVCSEKKILLLAGG